MKLSSASIERTLDRLDAEVIPDGHPAVAQLNEVFGEHTFFLGDGGLHIVEPVGDGPKEEGNIVKLASWSEASPGSLMPHEPEATDMVVPLTADGPERAS